MQQPTLIVMAAGMGSRYGGLKQIDRITDTGETIMDFSLYDAMMAGFNRVVFVIKEENQDVFKELIEDRAGKHMEVAYAFQKIQDLPPGYEVPQGREKPWGTAHAIYACRHLVKGPFAVINADDYYGPNGFQLMYDFLAREEAGDHFAMISYRLRNTITEHGHVSRGVCTVKEDKPNELEHIVERTKIMYRQGKICYAQDEGEERWVALDPDTRVSMNFFGYTQKMMKELEERFPAFLEEQAKENPLKSEYMIPQVTGGLLERGEATVTLLDSQDCWYGVTYKEDRDKVASSLQALKDKGLYPEKLWK